MERPQARHQPVGPSGISERESVDSKVLPENPALNAETSNPLALTQLLSFFDRQGNEGAVLGEVNDDVAAVGFDGVEEGR